MSHAFTRLRARTLCLSALLSSAAPPAFAEPPRARWTAEEIVVTAQRPAYAASDSATATKTLTPIHRTPQSIQVLSETLLLEQDRRTLADALENVSGVAPIKLEELVLADPLVRGFAGEVYVDGLPAYGTTSVISPGSLAGVERIEIAKGPTAALYGGGAGAPLGGLINLVLRTPLRAPRTALGARIGAYDAWSVSGDVNRPLGSNAALRLAGEYEDRKSWIEAVVAESVQLTPSFALGLGSDTTLRVTGLYNHVDQLEYAGFPAALIAADGVDPETFSGATDAPHTTVENAMATAVLTHRFGTGARARLTGRRYQSEFREYASFPYFAFYPPRGTAYDIIKARLPTDVDQTTLDANVTWRAVAGGRTHQFLLGASWDDTAYDAGIGFDFTPIGTLDYADPAPLAFGAVPAITSTQTDRFETLAAYVQDQVDIGPVHLLASARYSRLDYARREYGYDRTYHRLTPRMGATVDLTRTLAAFAGYAEGFRAPTGFYGAAPPKLETSKAWEAGLKRADRGRGLSGTLALYQIMRRNVSTDDPDDLFNTIQTGAQRARGIEADLIWEPSPALSVLFSYAYTHARVTEDTDIPEGDRLPRAPDHSGRLALRYRVLAERLKGFAIGAGLTGVSNRDLTLPNTSQVAGHWVGDLQASYAFDPVTLSLSIVNLTDEDYLDPYQYLGQAVVIPGQPRALSVSLRARF